MNNKQTIRKFLRLRKFVFSAIAISLEEDCHGKSYEGQFKLGIDYLSYFKIKRGYKPLYFCEYNCYLFCEEGRGKTWGADTWEDLYKKVARDILDWIELKEDLRDLENDDELKKLFQEYNKNKKLVLEDYE